MPPAPDVVEVRLLLRRFAMERDRWIAGLCRRVGSSRSDYDALEALDAHGPLTPGELGTLLSLTSGSVTALVGRLEVLGWARREPHPDDRRKVIVSLTEWWRLSHVGVSVGLIAGGFLLPLAVTTSVAVPVGGSFLVGSLLSAGILYWQLHYDESCPTSLNS